MPLKMMFPLLMTLIEYIHPHLIQHHLLWNRIGQIRGSQTRRTYSSIFLVQHTCKDRNEMWWYYMMTKNKTTLNFEPNSFEWCNTHAPLGQTFSLKGWTFSIAGARGRVMSVQNRTDPSSLWFRPSIPLALYASEVLFILLAGIENVTPGYRTFGCLLPAMCAWSLDGPLFV